jgi:hypothetical protein
MPVAAETQNQQPQFYKQVVALSNEGHADWKIKPINDFSYAADTNAVLVTAVEFLLVSREYPIVFIDSGQSVIPVAVLGLKTGQNLFVTEDTTWDAKYVPAYVRRYPFILSGTKVKSGETSYTVCLDEAYPGFGKKDGEALFEKSGNQSDYLKNVVAFLKDYQSQGLATERFCKTIKKLDILEPMQANLKAVKGEDLTVAGFMVVSRDKLKSKKPLELAELIKSDEMELIYHHLASLGNFSNLTVKYGNLNTQ